MDLANEGDSLRDSIKAAYDTHSASTEPQTTPEPPPTPAPVEEPQPQEGEGQDDASKESPKDGRDAKGRFAKPTTNGTPAPKNGKASITPIPAQAQNATATPAPQPGAQTETKAPASWKLTAKEDWGKAPPSIQQEVIRREREIEAALKQSNDSRRLADSFAQTVSPFMGMIRAEGGDPIRTVGSLLETAAALRTAPPAHKAKIAASIVKDFGIPIDLLDAELAGQPVPQNNQAPYVDPSHLRQQITQDILHTFQQQREQSHLAQANSEIQDFAQNKEFFQSVKTRMGVLMRAAAEDGLELKLEDAYDAACRMDPEVSKVLQQREEHSQANAQNASTQRARAAASSVKSQPTVAPAAPQPDDLRSSILASVAKLSGR